MNSKTAAYLFISSFLPFFSQMTLAEENIRDPKPGEPGYVSPARSLTQQVVAACPSSPFTPPEANDSNFLIDCGSDLDTGCTFSSGGPLVFTIPIGRFLGDVAKLKASALISETANLKMPAFDVDFNGGGRTFNPERDRVSFNGNIVPSVSRTATG